MQMFFDNCNVVASGFNFIMYEICERPGLKAEKADIKNIALIGEHCAWMRVSLVRGLCKVILEAAVLQTQRRRRRRLSTFFKKLG